MLGYYVYAHVNPVTLKPFYIGKGINERAYNFESIRNKFWLNTFKKYGAGVIKLAENLTNEQSIEIEKQYIEKFGLRIHGGILTNLSYGGYGGRTIFEHNIESVRKKCRESKLGKLNPNFGKRIWPIGKRHTNEAKQKLRNYRLGKKLPDEVKIKVLIGLKKAAEASLKSRTHKVRCLITGKIWNGRQDCIKELGITLMCYKQRIMYNKLIGGHHLQLIK